MSVRRGRGRPKKTITRSVELVDADADLSIITTAVAQVTRKRASRRATSGNTDSGSNDSGRPDPEALDGESDNDFVPEDFDEIEIDLDDDAETGDLENGPKKSKAKAKKKIKLSGPGTGSGSRLEKKGRVIRALKDLSSARDKIERLYGLNQEKLLTLAKVKEAFETCIFCFPSEKLQRDSSCYVECTPPCAKWNVHDILIGSDKAKCRDVKESELNEIFERRKKELSIIVGEAEIALGSQQKAEFPVFPYGHRRGFVYNSGCLITDIAWLHQEERTEQFLAVSLSQCIDKPLDKRLQMFDVEKHVSCIEIFSLNPQTLEFSKIQTIAHNFGETWNLKWHEGCQTADTLGTLAFVCQDGSVKLLEVRVSDEYEIKFFEQPSISISIPKVSITCYDFLSPTTIVCGFKNGFVAEFDLTDVKVPSFYRKVHDSYIISLSIAYSEFEDPVVATISVDGYFYVFDPKDIFTSKTTVTRFRGTNIIPVSYIPQLFAFINSDGANSLKTVVPRAAFAIHPVCLQETTVTSVGTSRRHPLALTGTSDGNVIIANVARRLLTGIKNASATHTSLRLWKWEYCKNLDKYRLNHSYEQYKLNVNEVSGIKVDAHGVNISCVKWNETPSGGQFYAFANSAGLLTIEKLKYE